MIVLGLDPGSRITGYGLIRLDHGKSIYLASGCVRLTDKHTPSRLYTLHKSLIQLVEQYQPDVVSIEQVFLKNNVASLVKLSQARGVLIAAAASCSREIFEYTPRAIKQAVVGYGAADKAQVQQMICHLLSLPKAPQQDAADALAAAICHIHTQKISV